MVRICLYAGFCSGKWTTTGIVYSRYMGWEGKRKNVKMLRVASDCASGCTYNSEYLLQYTGTLYSVVFTWSLVFMHMW